jgi:thioredoxin reductase (NADPH)
MSLHTYDVLVVGSGPAGMSAAVSSAAEGYSTLVVEPGSLGGQVAHSSRVENVIGWPIGLPGHVLMEQTVKQAHRLGVEFSQRRVTGLAVGRPDGLVDVSLDHRLEFAAAKAVVLATGVRTRKLTAPGCEALEGRGVWYMTTPRNEEACTIRPAVVVGAGNSAGQAAIHLATRSPRVLLVVRGNDISRSMSHYLVERIRQTPNVEVRYRTQVDQCDPGADGDIEAAWLSDPAGSSKVYCGGVYVMIGAAPSVEWTGLQLDDDGYIVAPDFATSMPGVLAVGDVRSGSVKRVATAAGEGAAAMRHINRLVRPELYQ